MKTNTQLWSELALGELSNLNVSEDQTILPSERAKIMVHANAAMLRLYSRFVLKEQDVLVEMHEHITNYHLLKRFALCAGEELGEDLLYIQDLPGEPFKEDVIKVLSVFDSFHNELPLNDIESRWSVFTPQANMIQVPRPVAGQMLTVAYQAKPEELSYQEPDQLIPLPDVLWDVFKRYIAYRVTSFMNTQEMTAKGQEHLMIFESLCQEIIERDLVGSSVSNTNTRFHSRGWI